MKCSAAALRATGQRSLPRLGRMTKIACAASSLLVLGAATVVACGPDFPLQLLDDRAGTLSNTPANSFAWEAAHLVTPADKLQADERSGYEQAAGHPDDPRSLRMIEKGQLEGAQWAALQAMRAASDGESAYAAGAALPPAIRLYTAGAQDFRANALTAARQRFEAVLALPPQQASERAVWAAFMLGRLHAIEERRAEAIASFTKARALAVSGAPDPLGLAVASYGEQARLMLSGQSGPCNWSDFNEGRDCGETIPPADFKQAIRLYAEQAARGSYNAQDSLTALAAWSLGHADISAALIDDPVAQRLLVAYALARVGDIAEGSGNGDSYYDPSAPNSGSSGYPDAARSAKVKPNSVLVTLVDALKRRGLEKIEGADRVAALAYRTGRYDLAATLANRQETALSWWVRAKLALRKGDTAAAVQAYARAAQGFPRNDASLDPSNANLLMGEQGVLTLSRGQYVEALTQFHQAASDSARQSRGGYYGDYAYANDMAYVAERVLTVDELKTYVDAHAPASPMPSAQALAKEMQRQGRLRIWEAASRLSPPTLEDNLRLLLAQRLVREGRVDEALAYFPDDRDERFVYHELDQNYQETGRIWRLRAKAREYGEALERGQHGWRAVTRAQGWYEAAVIARRQGMEIMGYEQGPDYAVYGGSYPGGAGRGIGMYGNEDKPLPDNPQARAQADLPGPLVTDEERRRYAASEAKPYKRFHYRDIAADYIMKSADALPARSQAFAAVLCQGVNFVYYDQPRAEQLYLRYVKEGAAVPFSADFGQNCVEPDFAAAARFPYVQAWRSTRRWVSQHRALSAALLLGAAVGAGFGVAQWRRRRRAAKTVA
ncbi:MAG: hypothetical protein J0I15_15290 [Herbaspirillum huttiense]|uniref:hypothetical protein n=1 Tax=Herbaspirillum huttiense TaxID=863372 RepID=UPI001ACC1841|nr:hypothetical protein [Herbaspirillum huttiense]MBN9357814.1 hypothetical protein [Herbaspirillum huttiense]